MKLLLIFSLALAAPLETIPNQYIVTFSEDVARDPHAELPHYRWLEDMLASLGDRGDYQILHRYNIAENYKGYAARVPPTMARLISEMPSVASIEQDEIISISSIQPQAPSWGLSRIAQRKLPLLSNYTYPDKAGEGVTVYVVDTGVNTKHPDFAGRAVPGQSFSNDGVEDGNGHGTHCAGTIAGTAFGVAKKAKIVGVKVLDDNGSGSYASVIAGINWVAQNATAENIVGKAVASMSLGGSKNIGVNQAVSAAVKAGIPFVVAAGNSYGQNACGSSPSSEPLAITVAASDKYDSLAQFSNVGPCVDIIAPGVDITSAWLGIRNKTISGTSMATPHVAGVVALLLAEKQLSTADELASLLLSHSTSNVIKGVPANTANKFLFNGIDTYPTSQEIDEMTTIPLPHPEVSVPEKAPPLSVNELDGISAAWKEYLKGEPIQSYDWTEKKSPSDIQLQQQDKEQEKGSWWSSWFGSDDSKDKPKEETQQQQQTEQQQTEQQQQSQQKEEPKEVNFWESWFGDKKEDSAQPQQQQQQQDAQQQQQGQQEQTQQQQQSQQQEQAQQGPAPRPRKSLSKSFYGMDEVKPGELPVDNNQQTQQQTQQEQTQQQQQQPAQQEQGSQGELKTNWWFDRFNKKQNDTPQQQQQQQQQQAEVEIPVHEFPQQQRFEGAQEFNRFSAFEKSADALDKSKEQPKEIDPLAPFNPESPANKRV